MPARPLSKTHPALSRQWHPTRNGGFTPNQATAGMGRKVWWICPKDARHEYQAFIYSRAGGSRCSICTGRVVIPQTSLAKRFPKIAAQWDGERNRPLTPLTVYATSQKKVWWRCPKGPDHRWRTRVHHRTVRGSGCPYCSNQKTAKDRSLAFLYPEVVRQWDRARNAPLTPADLTPGSNRPVWWRCPKGPDHLWQAPPNRRVKGVGCPACANMQPSVTNRLSERHPDLAKFWHPTRNGELTPKDVVYTSTRFVWWRCKKSPDHLWRRRIWDQLTVHNTCPFCRNRRVSRSNCLAKTHPAIARTWDQARNGALTPRDVTAHSGKYAWWRCPKGSDHRWRVRVADRTAAQRNCPFCEGQRLAKDKTLAAHAPEASAQWHPTRNGALRPNEVHYGANRVAWWKCPAGPDHEWRSAIFKRGRDGHRCPFCANKRLSVTNSLAAQFPELAAEWDKRKNGALRPDQVTFGTPRKVWWKCHRGEGHEWQTGIVNRTGRSRSGCPFCSGKRIPEHLRLLNARPELAREWHPSRNGELTPYDVREDSQKVAWWRCGRNPRHTWRERIDARTRDGSGCPVCYVR